MKKTLLATAFTLALGSTSAMAGGIQIDPTGSGSIGGSTFVVDPGNSFGNALAQGVFPQPAGTPTAGRMFIQNAIALTGLPGRLTFVMDIPVLASHFPIPGAPGGINYDTAGGSGTGSFHLYYEDAGTGGVAASKAAGTGFTDDAWLASGSVTLTPGASWLFTSAVPGTVPLASNDGTPTIQGSGSTAFDIDFTSLNPAYVVNDVVGLTIDMDMANTLATPFTGAGVASSSFAEAGAAPISYGTDGANDYGCGFLGSCDMQMMANTTFNFRARQVPEPAVLGLMGLGLLGFAGSRRRKKAS